MPLDRLAIYHLQTPLPPPGRLGRDRFDSFVALAAFMDGTYRVGESTVPLRGAQEITEQARYEYNLLSRGSLLKAFLDRNAKQPYITAPIFTCLDPTLGPPVSGEVSQCPLLPVDDAATIFERVGKLVEQGHKVAHVDLPSGLKEAQKIIRETTRAGEELGMVFRYDAHEGLDLGDAQVMVGWLDHPTTEVLEQPLPAIAWRQMALLYEMSPIPLMLDEAIVDGGDVFRAADCADYVKLKLAKNGSPSRLLELIRQAREIGLKVILGSSIQTPLGCWLECQVHVLAGLQNAGAMSSVAPPADAFLASVLPATTTGFLTGTAMAWPELERALQRQCLRQWQVPTGRLASPVMKDLGWANSTKAHSR